MSSTARYIDFKTTAIDSFEPYPYRTLKRVGLNRPHFYHPNQCSKSHAIHGTTYLGSELSYRDVHLLQLIHLPML